MKRIVMIVILMLISTCFVEASIYKVKDRDCLSKIAARYPGVSRKMIAEANNLKAPRYILRMGRVLTIPSPVKKVVSSDDRRFHLVKKGDAIWKIARKYGATVKTLVKINNLKNPKLIRIGQKIYLEESLIPRKSRKKGLKRKAKIFHWRHPGADKFGNRDKEKGINLFSVPNQVKKAWLAKVKAGDMKYISLKNGVKFKEMLFGNFHLKKNVITDWQKGKRYFSHLYVVEYKGMGYELIRPLVCSNWSWKITTLKVAVKPKPVKIFVQSVKIEQTDLEPADKFDDLEEEFVEENCLLKNWESNIYGGYWHGVSGNTSGSHSYYFGGTVDCQTALPSDGGKSRGEYKYGLRLSSNYWDGIAANNFEFDGYRIGMGPILKWSYSGKNKDGSVGGRTMTIATTLEKQRDNGVSGNGLYKSHQDTNILGLSVAGDAYESGYSVKDYEWWAQLLWDYSHKKSSSWNGSKIKHGDGPSDKTSINAGFRRYIYHGKKVRLGFGGEGNYAVEDDHVGLGGGLYLGDVQERIQVGLKARHVFNSKYPDSNGTSIGVGADADLRSVVSWIIAKVNKMKEEKEVDNIPEKSSELKKKSKNEIVAYLNKLLSKGRSTNILDDDSDSDFNDI